MTLDNENAELRHCVQGDSCEYDRHNILFRFQSEDITGRERLIRTRLIRSST